MRLLLILVLVILSVTLASAASLLYMPGVNNPIGPRLSLIWNFTGVSGGGGGCTNALNFSLSCNSQYIPVVF